MRCNNIISKFKKKLQEIQHFLLVTFKTFKQKTIALTLKICREQLFIYLQLVKMVNYNYLTILAYTENKFIA